MEVKRVYEKKTNQITLIINIGDELQSILINLQHWLLEGVHHNAISNSGHAWVGKSLQLTVASSSQLTVRKHYRTNTVSDYATMSVGPDTLAVVKAWQDINGTDYCCIVFVFYNTSAPKAYMEFRPAPAQVLLQLRK